MKTILLTAAATLGLTAVTMAQVPNYVPTNGLVGWWPFNGNAIDESGNGNNGTLSSPTLTNDRFGISNTAININQSNDIVCTSTLINNPQNFSISLWFKTDSTNGWIFGLDDGQCNHIFNWDRYLSINSNGNLEFRIFDTGNQNIIITSNNAYNDNQWHNCVYSLSNFVMSIYVDGQIAANSINNINASNYQGYWRIGGLGSSNIPYVPSLIGQIDDIGIWNRALSSCEIQDLYNAQLGSLAISAGPDQTVCSGNSLTLNASGGSNYQWNNNVLDGQPFTPTQNGSYIVSGTDSLGCIGSDTLTVTVLENASSTINQTALDSYTLNGQTYTQSGTYTQTIPAANGCDSVITLNLTLNFTGLWNSSTLNFSLFPNPATQHIQVNADHTLVGTEYRIFDNTGKLVLSGILNAEKNTIDVSNLAIGTYVFKVGDNVKQSFKVMKQ